MTNNDNNIPCTFSARPAARTRGLWGVVKHIDGYQDPIIDFVPMSWAAKAAALLNACPDYDAQQRQTRQIVAAIKARCN
jgi:hypothetical protein